MCFPLGAGGGDFAKGTQLNFMIVTDNDSCTVYNNGSVFYSVDFNASKGYNPNTWDLSDEIAKLKPAAGNFPLAMLRIYSRLTLTATRLPYFQRSIAIIPAEKGTDTAKRYIS